MRGAGEEDLALLKRRYGAHLSDAARKTLAECRPYPSSAVIKNPLTRPLARRVAEADWRATLSQIDFDYTLENRTVGGVPCVAYKTPATKAERPLILYLHAGAFVTGSARDNASGVLPSCHLSGCEAIAVDYSLAPESVFPRQLIEIENVYKALLQDGGNASSIVLLGDSAGGALAVSSLYRWRRNGIDLPASLVLLSPLLDAAAESDTHETMKGRDPLFATAARDAIPDCFRLYAGDGDLSDPEISPMTGDPRGLPPILIHAGTRETLLGDSARFAEKARRAKVDVALRVFDGMFHLFHQHWRLDDAKAAHQDIADFIGRTAV